MPPAVIPIWIPDSDWIAVVAGLAMLILGADWLVRGAVWIALALGMSRMTVGLTLVAMGTSMPEMLVSLSAARSGHSAIALANVLGSNVANILLIVGLAAALKSIRLTMRWLELVYMLLATLIVGVPFVAAPMVGRGLAAAMILMLCVFCVHLLYVEKARKLADDDAGDPPTGGGWLRQVATLLAGLGMLCVGAEWLVGGAVALARQWQVSDAVIGMTIVAVGTSLPELATSAVAAVRGQPEIAVGNVVGSNIFNVGAVLGISAAIQPFAVDVPALGRLMAMTLASALALVLVLRWQRGVPRGAGVVFLIAYAIYLGVELRLTSS